MGIFTGLFKSRDKPQNRTSGSNYAFFFGGTTSGKSVTERSAMQMTAVYSCVRILSEAVAGLPLHLYKYTDSGGKAMALDHPLYRLLHDEPNPEMSSFVFRETLMTHLLLWGNAYAQIIRNGKNEIVALYPLMPNKMSVDRDEDGLLYYTYYRGTDEAIKNKEFAVTLQPSDVLHIPGLGFDGLVGYSPIAMAKNAIGMATNPTAFESKPYIKLYGSGAVALMIQPQGRGMMISDLDEYIEIDSELMNCFKGTVLKNDTVKGTEFPVFKSGVCTINCTGDVTRIEVIPRWCCL